MATNDVKKKIFTDIYEKNTWGSETSRSGQGSELIHTEPIRFFLSSIFDMLNINTMLDAPCGDCNWQIDIQNIENIKYTGVDIVEQVVEKNKELVSLKYKNMQFKNMDIINESINESYDLILCRDCLQHLPISEAKKVIVNMLNGNSKYFMTNFHVCNNDRKGNIDISYGEYYKINVLDSPFNFPPPMIFIQEHPTLNLYRSKTIGLWEIKTLKKALQL